MIAAAQEDRLVAAPVAAADVEPDAGVAERGAVEHLVHEVSGELELLGGIAALGERRAHEGAGAPVREHELGEHRLVELDEGRARARQRLDLLPQDARHVGAEVLLGRVGGAARRSARTSRASAGKAPAA